MLHKLEDVIGCNVAASDRDVGKVRDALFDREKWAVRHLVVDTGNWMTGNQVLVSPIAVKDLALGDRTVRVDMTAEQIENAPSIASDQPVSRHHESSFYQHYSWPPYWAGSMLWGQWAAPRMVLSEGPESAVEQEIRAMDEARRDENLHSFNAVNGYAVEASDGRMGDIEDMVIDGETWKVAYFVVDTSKFLPSKDVLVPPENARSIDYHDGVVHITMTKDELRSIPEFTSIETLAAETERGQSSSDQSSRHGHGRGAASLERYS